MPTDPILSGKSGQDGATQQEETQVELLIGTLRKSEICRV